MEAEKTRERRSSDKGHGRGGTLGHPVQSTFVIMKGDRTTGSTAELGVTLRGITERGTRNLFVSRKPGTIRTVAFVSEPAGRVAVASKARSIVPKRMPAIEGDPRDLAKNLGAPPGKPLKVNIAREVLRHIASSASDLFPTTERAEKFLRSENFAGSKQTALELVKAGKATTVLARLDELRYGSQG